MKKYILALDQGTTSSRAIVFDKKGKVISNCQKEFTQIFPKPGWVEHNPLEIWKTQKDVAVAAMRKASVRPEEIASVGITNQRETTILWERRTGRPVYNAIVWQCRRTADICRKLEKKGYGEIIRRKTGLLLDAYFSGTKVKWLLDNVRGLRKRAERGEICFGTVDSWLLYNLTGEHLTDVTNASRTLLLNIRKGAWDKELLDIFGIPEEILPAVRPSCGFFGMTKSEIFGKDIAVGGVAGDQQASLFGQACFSVGSAKNTYGTGCFALVNIGKKFVLSKHRLLTTIAWDLGDGIEYALEGSVFIGGAVVKWLRDQQKMLKIAGDSESLALSVPDTGGVYFVPAFVGLGAPYWDSSVRGTIVGLTRGSSSAHIVRAALESVAFQSRDLIAAVEEDVGHKVKTLKVDGGATVNRFLMQFQADILGIPVICSAIPETTALGAAYLAGLQCGYWKNKEEIRDNWRMRAKFSPRMGREKRRRLLGDWKRAVEAARHFSCGE
ncbi:MAG: glycerol kinase GlpK [Candidatus Omnitrophica bacterium]|nr:glycerol kinase GlpK [Candidatus Omnitrophota bacterium]